MNPSLVIVGYFFMWSTSNSISYLHFLAIFDQIVYPFPRPETDFLLLSIVQVQSSSHSLQHNRIVSQSPPSHTDEWLSCGSVLQTVFILAKFSPLSWFLPVAGNPCIVSDTSSPTSEPGLGHAVKCLIVLHKNRSCVEHTHCRCLSPVFCQDSSFYAGTFR